MLTSAKTMTPPLPHSAAFAGSTRHSSRRSAFSILRADKSSSAACYGVIALVVLVGIAVNLVLLARTVSSIIGAAQ